MRLEMHELAYFYHFPPESIRSMSIKEREMWHSMVRKQIEFENEGNNGKPNIDNSNSPKNYKESS